MIPTDDLLALKQTLDDIDPVSPEPGDYAELVDENDPNGIVQICRQNGQVMMLMSREVYEAMLKWNEGA